MLTECRCAHAQACYPNKNNMASLPIYATRCYITLYVMLDIMLININYHYLFPHRGLLYFVEPICCSQR